MADPKKPDNGGDKETKTPKMTKHEAASLVRRQVRKRDARGQIVKDKDGKAVVEERPVKTEEVMALRDYGAHVVVVTTSGEKLRGEKPRK